MKRLGILVLLFWGLVGVLGAVGTGSSSGSSASPKTADDWYNAGYAASNKGDNAGAAADFQKAVDLRANYPEALNMLGFSLRKMGKLTEAFSFYDKALKLRPNFPEAREYYGEAWLQSGDLAKAVQQYVILAKAKAKEAPELLEKIDAYVNK